MIQSKDLQVGDWVRIKENVEADAYYLHDELRPGQYIKVEEILGIGINPDWCSGEINTMLPYDAIEFVPLTEEILKKNGIYYRMGHGGYPIVEIEGINCRVTFNLIRYVHQLQHALKLCGIDKEITL